MDMFFSAILAGMVYVLIPGPATLAVLGLSSTKGRFAAAQFLGAHLVGDILWSLLAFLAIIGVSSLGPELFQVLGMLCGAYLIWLGWKALNTKTNNPAPIVTDPVRAGLLFGLTNPKAYPFAVAMFTALLGTSGTELSWNTAPVLLAGCTIGFLLADTIVVFWTGMNPIRRLFAKRAGLITRLTGFLFIAFGTKSIFDATASLRAKSQ
ncbi:MAG: LysE family translocator [Beijerinckiaceae bacterium]